MLLIMHTLKRIKITEPLGNLRFDERNLAWRSLSRGAHQLQELMAFHDLLLDCLAQRRQLGRRRW